MIFTKKTILLLLGVFVTTSILASTRVWLHDREGVKYEVLYTFEETDYKCLDIPGYTDMCDSNPQLNKDEAYLESDGWLEGYYEVKEYNLKMKKGDVVVRITDRGTKKR